MTEALPGPPVQSASNQTSTGEIYRQPSSARALSVPLLQAAAGQAPAAVLALLAGPVGAAVAEAAG